MMTITYKRLNDREILEDVDGQVRTIPEGSDLYAAILASGAPIQDADPPPVVYSGSRPIGGRLRTTNATPTELYRATLAQNTAYAALLTVWGLTDDLAGFRRIEATAVVGRGSNGAVVIQTRVNPADATINSDHARGSGGSWPLPTIAAVGNDIVIRVTGAFGTTINWLLTGSFESVTPGGQP